MRIKTINVHLETRARRSETINCRLDIKYECLDTMYEHFDTINGRSDTHYRRRNTIHQGSVTVYFLLVRVVRQLLLKYCILIFNLKRHAMLLVSNIYHKIRACLFFVLGSGCFYLKKEDFRGFVLPIYNANGIL